jgi:FAD/FMN-containing dehydrogenase
MTPRPAAPNHVSDASGFSGWAEGVFAPHNESELLDVIAHADSRRIPLTILGAGSGLTGARVATGGWVVSLEHFNRLEILQGRAYAGAAITLEALNRAANPTGQFYAPDPTENTASVGGTISTNASGSRSFRFGSTRRHVLALRVVMMDGAIHEFRRGDAVDFDIPPIPMPDTRKCTAGYPLRPGMDWIDLFCGAEGTLGVILEAELRLLPLPRDLFSAVIFFPSDELALDAIDSWRPLTEVCMIEYFDRNSLDLMRPRYAEIPVAARAALLLEAEGDDIDEWQQRLEAASALIDGSWFAVSASDRERFRKFRHGLPELVNATMANRGFMKMGTDYAVPIERNRDMLRYYRDRLEAVLPGHYVIYGHIGDAHVHVNMLPASEAELREAESFMTEFASQAVKFGGTVSAEHGLGKRKAYFLQLQYGPEAIAAMTAVKRKLDPHWILGRGTLLPVPDDVELSR